VCQNVIFCLLLLLALPSILQGQTILGIDSVLTGDWSGDVTYSTGLRNRVILHIVSYTNGPCTATWDSPNAGYFGNSFSSVSCANGRLLFESQPADVVVTGFLDIGALTITGTWLQRKTNSPIVLRKILAVTHLQETRLAQQSQDRELSIPNRPAGNIVGAVLTLPDTLGRYPLAILAGDRGQFNRDQRSASGHAPGLVMASLFASRGIATLRLDDRGTGLTTGTSDPQSMDDEASDISAALRRIRFDKNIDTTRVVIIGFGEGGLACAIVASRYPDLVTSIVCLSTPGLSGRATLTAQIMAREISRQTDEELAGVASDLVDRWCAITQAGGSNAELTLKILAVADSIIDDRPDLMSRYPLAAYLKRAGREEYVSTTLLPWIRSFLWYNPANYFGNVTQPILALFAVKDIEVPAAKHAEAFRRLDKISRKVMIESVDDVNHMFQSCDACTEEEMAQTNETINENVVTRLVRWVVQGK